MDTTESNAPSETGTSGGGAAARLLDLLDLRPPEVREAPPEDGPDVLRGRAPAEGQAPVYGGHMIAQALAAVGRTVLDPELRCGSLHASFVRPTRLGVPFDYAVERVADTRAFATRRVRARQGGREVFHLTASLHRTERGPVYQDAPMPDVPDPESLPTHEERLSKAIGQHVEPLGMGYDMRFIGPLSFEAAGHEADRAAPGRVWMRVDGEVPADVGPLAHACLLGYLSDATPLDTVVRRHGLNWLTSAPARIASLDHGMWFHRPARADEWLLLDSHTPVTFGARSLVRGRFFDRGGHLVASMVQEVLLRADPA